MSTILIKYLDKLNNIKNRYSIPYTQNNMKEEHYVELMYEELSIEMIKEIERLNNIINEFDKWLDEESEKTILSTGHLTCLMMCKNKLQELKGSDK